MHCSEYPHQVIYIKIFAEQNEGILICNAWSWCWLSTDELMQQVSRGCPAWCANPMLYLQGQRIQLLYNKVRCCVSCQTITMLQILIAGRGGLYVMPILHCWLLGFQQANYYCCGIDSGYILVCDIFVGDIKMCVFCELPHIYLTLPNSCECWEQRAMSRHALVAFWFLNIVQ